MRASQRTPKPKVYLAEDDSSPPSAPRSGRSPAPRASPKTTPVQAPPLTPKPAAKQRNARIAPRTPTPDLPLDLSVEQRRVYCFKQRIAEGDPTANIGFSWHAAAKRAGLPCDTVTWV